MSVQGGKLRRFVVDGGRRMEDGGWRMEYARTKGRERVR